MTPVDVLDLVLSVAAMDVTSSHHSLLSAEQAMLLLHIESLLPLSLRVQYLTSSQSDNTNTVGNRGQAIVKFRDQVLESVLASFNAVSSPAPTTEGDVVDNIVDAFTLLPYVLPGGCTSSCAYPVVSSALQLSTVVDLAIMEAEQLLVIGKVGCVAA